MNYQTYAIRYAEAQQAYNEAFVRFEKFEDYVTFIDMELNDIKYSKEYQDAKAEVVESLDALSLLNSLVPIEFVQQSIN